MDDTWSAGYVGLYRHPGIAAQQFDDVTIGYDNNGDGDILDAGDDVQVSDNFSTNAMSLSYDTEADRGGRAKGNLTDDGALHYVYDGWNRLVKVQRVAAGDTTTVAEYGYLPDNRRASKVVSHSGVEAVANDGGDTTVHFYYGGVPWASGGVSRWNICETRNGSEQVTRQWVWGTQYVDEPVFMDVNLDPATDDDCDPDTTGTGEDGETHDRRYFYVQDRNWNVVALVESDDGVGVQGRIAERYSYTPYGEFVVLKGQTGSGNLGNVLPTSTVGNVFAHQGLPFDQEKGSYQNRHREYKARVHHFMARDPIGASAHLGYAANSYEYVREAPARFTDPQGLDPSGCCCAGGAPPTNPNCSDCWQTCISGAGQATLGGEDGDVICRSDGCKCACVNQIALPGGPPGSAARLKQMCAILHEEDHVSHSSDFCMTCNCKNETSCLGRLSVMAGCVGYESLRECQAYNAEINCLGGALGEGYCGNDAPCRAQIQTQIRELMNIVCNEYCATLDLDPSWWPGAIDPAKAAMMRQTCNLP